MIETRKRTLIRIISWRIIATLIIAAFAGLSSAIVINILLIIAHYIHERGWLKLKWGTGNDN
jgi:hypothetical protein